MPRRRSMREKTQEMSKLVLTEVPMIPIRQGAVELVMSKGLNGYTYWFHGLPDARDVKRAWSAQQEALLAKPMPR